MIHCFFRLLVGRAFRNLGIKRVLGRSFGFLEVPLFWHSCCKQDYYMRLKQYQDSIILYYIIYSQFVAMTLLQPCWYSVLDSKLCRKVLPGDWMVTGLSDLAASVSLKLDPWHVSFWSLSAVWQQRTC